MKQPQGFINTQFPDHVCQLKKAIYGLKQAPRQWFATLTQHLHTLGFTASHADPSLFLHSHHNIYTLIYVDDLLITGSNSISIHQIIQKLQMSFQMKDLGSIS